MKTKLKKWIAFIAVFCLAIFSMNIVSAEDHQKLEGNGFHYKYEKFKQDDDDFYKTFRKHEVDDDFYKHYRKHDDDKDYLNDDYTEKKFQNSVVQPSYWNIWTRDSNVTSSSNLPVQEAKTFAFQLNGKTENLFVLPSNGQLLVSGEKMADLLGVKSKFYNQSRILELSDDQEELIVRSGTNAAYENMVKTPMPTTAIYYEKTVYLPVSVIANAFGYSVNWDENNEMFILEPFHK